MVVVRLGVSLTIGYVRILTGTIVIDDLAIFVNFNCREVRLSRSTAAEPAIDRISRGYQKIESTEDILIKSWKSVVTPSSNVDHSARVV